VEATTAYLVECETVFSGAISSVALPPVAGAQISQPDHQSVAVHLGKDGRRSNAEVLRIGPGAGVYRTTRLPQIELVDNHDRPWAGDLSHCGAHGESGGFEDVDAIDQLDPDFGDQPVLTAVQNPACSPVALLRTHGFGILDRWLAWNSVEGDSSHHDRTGEATPTDLVDPDDGLCVPEKGAVLCAA